LEVGFERIAFADVLRDIAYAIDPHVFAPIEGVPYEPGPIDEGVSPFIGHYAPEPAGFYARLTNIIDAWGWDYAKNNVPDVRRLLQRLGTEAGRDILGENIWVDTAFSRAAGGRLVVTDVRFPNEAQGIRDRGGLVIRIERPGVGPRNDHPSETSLIGYAFDHVIDNSGSIEDLHESMRALCLKEPE
jgi:hypothetical protein